MLFFLRSYCFVGAVAEDGFNPDKPEVDATSVIDEAPRITEWLVEHFDGKIDIILV